MQGALIWGDSEARRTGFLEYAATNDIIVVFPQNKDKKLDTKHCWTSEDTDNKDDPQLQFLLNLRDSLKQGDVDKLFKMDEYEQMAIIGNGIAFIKDFHTRMEVTYYLE